MELLPPFSSPSHVGLAFLLCWLWHSCAWAGSQVWMWKTISFLLISVSQTASAQSWSRGRGRARRKTAVTVGQGGRECHVLEAHSAWVLRGTGTPAHCLMPRGPSWSRVPSGDSSMASGGPVCVLPFIISLRSVHFCHVRHSRAEVMHPCAVSIFSVAS